MGHWFKGRIYEHRSDLSPNGRFLIYFASKINARTIENTDGYSYAWTAISSPPYYKAMMLWPKGDCWHGGGLFKSNRDVFLNHRADSAYPHPKHVSSKFKVTPNPEACGEDEPIHSMRLSQSGWICRQHGKFTIAGWAGWQTEQTEIWEKEGRAGKKLRRELLKIDFESYGGPYIERYTLVAKNGTQIVISDATWAELDQRGNLVFAKFGKVYRGKQKKDGIKEMEVMDLNGNEPPEKIANKTDAPDRKNLRGNT